MKWLMAGCAVLAAAMSWAYVEVDDDVVVDYQDPKTKLGFDVSGNEATIMWAPITLSGSYTIPSTLTGDGRDFKVTAIGSEAFYDCTRITALTIPEGVRSIEAEAFVNCAKMTSVTLPSTLERIDRCAFEDCVKLATLVIPRATTFIHDEAFDCCDTLRITVEDGNPSYMSEDGALLTADGQKLLFATGGQTEYSVPASVTELGDFSLGYTVKTVHFKGGVPSYSRWGQAFEPENITQITYTLAHKDEWEQVAGSGTWTVEYYAEGTTLTQRSIPVSPYGRWAVQGTNAQYLIVENGIVVGLSNKNIRGELVIPEEIDEPITGIADIFGSGDGPFAYCPYLTKVVIPGTVKSVATGTTTFLHCNSLKEVVLEEGVETMNFVWAFWECPQLSKITLPSTFKGSNISSGRLEGSENFARQVVYDIAPENPYFKVEGNFVVNKAGHPCNRPEGTVLLRYQGPIGASARVVVPEQVTHIADGACRYPAFGTLVMHAGVTELGAFEGSVYSDEDWGDDGLAVGGASGFEVDAANPVYGSMSGSLVRKADGETVLIRPYQAHTMTTCKVPEGVTILGDRAFALCETMRTVTLPSTLRVIGDTPFYNCTSLTEITIPKSVERMGDLLYDTYMPHAISKITFQGPPPEYDGHGWASPSGNISVTGYYPQSRAWRWKTAMAEDNDHNDTKWYGLPMASYQDITGPAKDLTYDENGVITGISNKLTSGALVIPEEGENGPVSGIAPDAFTDCTRITSVTVPGGISTISERTFVRMTGLKEVVFEEGVACIEANAFDGCTALTKVVIPASCTQIDPLAFANCPEIAFEVSPDNSVYQSVGGALLSKDGMRLIAAPGNVRAYSIPETVTVIGAGAFAANQGAGIYKLASVTLPASVRTIEEGAFAGFGKVVVDAANETYASTADGALFDKAQTTLYHVPNTVTTYTVPESVRSIAYRAFYGCSALTSVTSTATDIADEAFVNCPKLAKITFGGEPPALHGEGVFGTCKAGAYPALLTGKWAAVLDGDGMWAGLKMTAYKPTGVAGLLEYDTGSEDPIVTGIASSASGALVIPSGVTAIRPGAFDGATRLTAITVPGSVEAIQGGTFRDLSGLTTVTFQEGVEAIEAEAFSGCTKLTKIVIPASCTSIADGAFETCGNVVFEVAAGNPAYKTDEAGALLTLDGTKLVAAPGVASYDVPDGVMQIADYAFAGRPALTRVSLPASLQEVPDFAFIESAATLSMREENARFYTIDGALFMHDASGDGVTWERLLHVPTSVTTFVIPDGITVIDNYAFAGCSKLTQVTLPAVQGENDVTIGEHTFEGCTALKTVTFRGKPDLLFSVFTAWPATAVGYYPALWTAAWEAVLDADGKWSGLTMKAQVESGATGALVYGGTSDKPTITDIATTASGALEIPYGVTAIEPGALDGATRLTTIAIPGSVETIQGGTLKNLSGLTTVMLQEGVRTIEADAFVGCTKLTKVVIPASCTMIDPAAFSGCSGITFEVAVGNTAFSSKDGALLSKDGTVLHLAPGNAATYTIPVGVTTVAEQAFQNNVALTTAVVPAGVTTIEAHAFAACIRLTKVDFRGLPPTIIGAEAFGTCKAGAYIATYWREWDEVSDEAGVWNGLTMTTTPLTLTINRIGSGNVRDDTTTISRFPATRSFQPGRTITLTAVPASKNVLLGWSGDGSFETDGMTVTFSSENMTEITVHFVSQTVANSIEAVGMGPGGEDSSLEDALASGEVVRKEDIPDLVKEMAFGAPVIEVQDGSVRVGIDIQTAETLGDWKLLDLQNVEVQADAQERLMLIFKKPADSTAQFYKFVLPEEPSSKVKR